VTPKTRAGRQMLHYLESKDWAGDILAIEAEAGRLAVAELQTRREPGVYPNANGTIDVVVDVPEAASYLEDEYPDEHDEDRSAKQDERLREELRDREGKALLVRTTISAVESEILSIPWDKNLYWAECDIRRVLEERLDSLRVALTMD
jgi:hypothetical protein